MHAIFLRNRRPINPTTLRVLAILNMILVPIAVLIWLLVISGCGYTPRRTPYQRTTVRTVYESPTGGASVYRVDGPSGSNVVTVSKH